jgi:urease accessory protein
VDRDAHHRLGAPRLAGGLSTAAPEASAGAGSGWLGRLALRYWRDGPRTVALDRHEGPLRVLQRLYPEGEGICHHVMVHPPGGVAGGDVLDVQIDLGEDTHAVLTTPGATRFYRSAGRPARQCARLRVGPRARVEWLPLENIAFTGCEAENRTEIELGPQAEAMGWDLLALGLPAAGTPFEAGAFTQHVSLRLRAPQPELDGTAPKGQIPAGLAEATPHPIWLERGVIRAQDTHLLDSPLGWAGRRVLATVWWATAEPLPAHRRDTLLEAARDCSADPSLQGRVGVTSTLPQVIVARALADRVEPAMQWMCAVRAAWRREAWGLSAHPPRIWRT